MDNPLRRPEEILAYRSLRRILESRTGELWSVAPEDTALSALKIMTDKDIGFLVVLKNGSLVGVLSERDCARKMSLLNRQPDATPVADIMVRDIVTTCHAPPQVIPLT